MPFAPLFSPVALNIPFPAVAKNHLVVPFDLRPALVLNLVLVSKPDPLLRQTILELQPVISESISAH